MNPSDRKPGKNVPINSGPPKGPAKTPGAGPSKIPAARPAAGAPAPDSPAAAAKTPAPPLAKSAILYLETDEDITSAIDKLTHANAAKVQIVVPKRSTMLQSLINLRLLAKAARDYGIELILVTGDRTANHLASRVGLAVASRVDAAAKIPQPNRPEPAADTDVIEAEDLDPDDDDIESSGSARSKAAPVPIVAASSAAARAKAGAAAAAAAAAEAAEAAAGAESEAEATDADGPTPAARPKLPKAAAPLTAGAGASKPRVPNYNAFTKRMAWVAGIVALIAGGFIWNQFSTKATVTLFAKGQALPVDLKLTLDPTVKTADPDKAVVPAQPVTVTKELAGQTTATGKKDVGTKATGQISVKNCEDTTAHGLAVGTKFTGSGKQFVSTGGVTVPAGSFSGGGTKCNSAAVAVPVAAIENGDSYNLAPTEYTTTALVGNFDISGGQMTGGSSKTINVVTGADVERAKAEVIAKDKANVERELTAKASTGYVLVPATIASSTADLSANPAIDTEATTVAISLTATYTATSYDRSALLDLVKATAGKELGKDAQIYDDGAADLVLKTGAKTASGALSAQATTTAFGGVKLDPAEVATQLSGKRFGDAQTTASEMPGVERAEIVLWPSWANAIPKRLENIKVDIKISSPRG